MEQREKLLEQREQLKTECNKRLKMYVDASNKHNDLLPKFHNTPDGVQMATLKLEDLSKIENAEKDKREAYARYIETLEKILEINAKLAKLRP